MEWDAIGLNWERITPLAQAQFTGCSEADLKAAGGSRDALNRCIAKANGITEQEAAHQTQEWALKLEADPKDAQPRPSVASRYQAPAGAALRDAPRTARTEQGVNPPPGGQPAKE